MSDGMPAAGPTSPGHQQSHPKYSEYHLVAPSFAYASLEVPQACVKNDSARLARASLWKPHLELSPSKICGSRFRWIQE